jgi:hypothetical protein
MIFTKHAKERMTQYGVGEAEVIATVQNYNTCVPARDGCENRWKSFGSYRLRVTVNPTSMVIVTVWKETV